MKDEIIKMGVLGCAEIAYRRFMPAVSLIDTVKVVAVAEEYAPDKLKDFCSTYQLEQERDFVSLLERKDIQAVYIPQPPALHYLWALEALKRGKHVLVEKPATTSMEHTKNLVRMASESKLALHENYMFQYHAQIEEIRNIIRERIIGEIRLIRADFGFPMRKAGDFRFNKELGGGALLDAGGYAVKLAVLLLGDTARVETAHLSYIPGFDVDMYGSATISGGNGEVCQIGFGMDSAYQCSLTIWGSKGRLYTNRIFTAPADFTPTIELESASGKEVRQVSPDNHFLHSIEKFVGEIRHENEREESYHAILKQAELIEDINVMCG